MKKYLLIIVYLALVVAGFCAGGCTGEPNSTSDTGSIYGVVTAADTGEPMRATEVGLFIRNGNYYDDSYKLLLKTTTFADGHFEFDDLKEGEYVLAVYAEGYEEIDYEVFVEAGRTARVDLQLTKENTYMTVITEKVELNGSGRVIFKGNCSYSSYRPTEKGFIYNTTPELSIVGGIVVKAGDNFTAEVSGLAKGKWYVKAYAKNGVGYEFGNVLAFEISGNPEVATKAVTNITETTATLNGEIVYEGDPKFTERGFVYSSSYPRPTVDDPESATTKVIVSGNSKDFSTNIANLIGNKNYYARAYATGSNGTEYGEVVQFYTKTQYIIIDNLAIQSTDLGMATWADAKSMCKNSRVGDFSDWRLPTMSELEIIYQKKEEIGGFTSGNYWSSESSDGDPSVLSFEDGAYCWAYSSELNNVRAVRTVK